LLCKSSPDYHLPHAASQPLSLPLQRRKLRTNKHLVQFATLTLLKPTAYTIKSEFSGF